MNTTTAQIIQQKLEKALNLSFIELIDESAKHAGHAGAKLHGGGHFKLIIISNDFTGLTRILRHKLIYKILDTEFKNNLIHALAIKSLTEEELNDTK